METSDLATVKTPYNREKIIKAQSVLQPRCKTTSNDIIIPIAKTPRKALTVQQKSEILKFVDENKNMKRKDVAAMYNMSNSTLSDIVKRRAAVEELAKEHSNAIKRLKTSKYERIDRTLIQWFYQASANNININGVILKDKAKEIADELGIHDFRASNGWIGRFKSRYDVLQKKTSGKSRTVPKDSVDCWKTDILPGILANYHPEDIYSVDMFGLSTNTLSECNFVDGSNITERNIGIFCRDPFVILLCSNSDGSDRLRPLVVGTNEKLGHESTLLYTYSFNSLAWIRGEDFKRWIAQIDAKMAAENRKILLFVDNAAAHSYVLDLSNVKMILSPPNTPSCLLPIYRDILKNTKQYMQILMRGSMNYQIKNHIFKAISFFVENWWGLKPDFLKNCFIKSGFLTDSSKYQDLTVHAIKREFPSPLEDEFAQEPAFVKTEVTFEECDNHNEFSAIREKITDDRTNTKEDNNDSGQEITMITPEEALASIDNIKMFMVQNDGFDDRHWNNLMELENMIFMKTEPNRRKLTILRKQF